MFSIGSNAMTFAGSKLQVGTTSAPKFISMTARRKPFLTATGDPIQSRGLLRRDTSLEQMLLLKARRNAPASPEKDIAWRFIHSINELISLILCSFPNFLRTVGVLMRFLVFSVLLSFVNSLLLFTMLFTFFQLATVRIRKKQFSKRTWT